MYARLNLQAYEQMTQVFAERNHYPSPGQLQGLKEIQETMTQMLSGDAPAVYPISSLDPGVGKSTAISTWLQAFIKSSSQFPHKGVLLGLERLEEIQRFVEDCNMPEDCFAVMVQDGAMCDGVELNSCGLGKDKVDEALILFTTKAQIQRRSCGKNFCDIQALYYHGVPRAVRTWDEGFSCGTPVTMNPNDFGKLLSGLGEHHAESKQMVLKMISDTGESKAGDVYQVPELPLTRSELLYSIKWKTDEERELADLLGQLSGQQVTIREYRTKDAVNQIMVDCVQAIPNDFAPCLITDASARVKAAYGIQQKYQQNTKPLTTPDQYKSYRNLTVSVWKRSSSKVQIINDCDEVAREIAKVITSRPDEKFLLIRYLSQEFLEKAVMKLLSPGDAIPQGGGTLPRVNWLTWGKVTAVNHYRDIPNTIIVSPYFYREYAYESGAKAAGMRPTASGGVLPEEIANFRKGEVSHHLLQALRGTGRRSEGDTCPETRVWLIADPRTGIIRDLSSRIYPGCVVTSWITDSFSLTPNQQRAVECLKELFASGATEVEAKEVLTMMGMTRADNFKRDVRDSEDFQDHIKTLGFTSSKNGRTPVFRVITPPVSNTQSPL